MSKGYEELIQKNVDLKQELEKTKEINGALMREIRELRKSLASAHRDLSKAENELADLENKYYEEDAK